jgi:hypothetical protein
MRSPSPCGIYTSEGGLLAASNFHGIPIPPVTGHSSLAGHPTRPNPEAHGGRATNACLVEHGSIRRATNLSTDRVDGWPVLSGFLQRIGQGLPVQQGGSTGTTHTCCPEHTVLGEGCRTPFGKIPAPGFFVFRPDGGQRNGKSGQS